MSELATTPGGEHTKTGEVPVTYGNRMGHLEELGRGECLELLATHHLGRLGVVTGLHPTIFPVNYVLDGDQIVFRSDDGTKFTHAAGKPVAFEVDEIDEETRSGWSVHVWGRASEVTAAEPRDLQARIFSLPLHPWAPGAKVHYVRILTVSITGRRVTAPEVRDARPGDDERDRNGA